MRGEHVDLPGDVQPRCTMTGGVGRSRALLLTVAGPPSLGIQRPPLVQIGVAPDSLAGADLWRTWLGRDRDDRTPSAPWCCARLMPALALYRAAAHWLGDFERCVAWAWISDRC